MILEAAAATAADVLLTALNVLQTCFLAYLAFRAKITIERPADE